MYPAHPSKSGSAADGEQPPAPSAVEALQSKFRELSTRVVSAGRGALAPSSGQWPTDGCGDEDCGDTAPNTSGEHEDDYDAGEVASASGVNFASWLASQEFNASDIVWDDDEDVVGGHQGAGAEGDDVDEYVSIADATYAQAQAQGHHQRGAGWALIAGAWRRAGQCWGGEAEGGGCATISSLSSQVCEESSRVFQSGVSGGRVAAGSGEGRGAATRAASRRKDGSNNRKKKKKDSSVGAPCPQRDEAGLSDRAPARPAPADEIEEAPPSHDDGADAPPAPRSTDLARLFELDERGAGTPGTPGGACDHPSVADQSAATAATPLVGEDLLQEEAALQSPSHQHCDSTCCTYSISESSSPRGPGPSPWGPGGAPAAARACGGGSPVAAARPVDDKGEYPYSRAKVEKIEARRRRRRRMMIERKE